MTSGGYRTAFCPWCNLFIDDQPDSEPCGGCGRRVDPKGKGDETRRKFDWHLGTDSDPE